MTSTIVAEPRTSAGTVRRGTWALWGTAAGLLGVTANLVAQPQVTEADRAAGASVVEKLTQGSYHVGAIAGFGAVACLLLFAAGFRRWAGRQASDSLALHAVPLALVASAGALIAAYGVKGMLAAYLPGGFNESSYADGARYTYFLLDDLAGYYSWWGVTVAAACIAYLALRERLMPRWIGVLATLVTVLPLAFLVTVGFTGFSGIVAPVFLLIGATGMSRMRS